MRENRFLLFLNHLRLPYSIPKSFALLLAFHSARHTYAMMLTEKGISINVISALLCHKKLSSTQIYSKVTRQMAEEAIEKANIMGINKQKKGKSTISPELAL
jgi:integrase